MTKTGNKRKIRQQRRKEKQNKRQDESNQETEVMYDASVTSLVVIEIRDLDIITTSATCNSFSVSHSSLKNFVSDEDNYLFVAIARPIEAIAGILLVIFTNTLDGAHARVEERQKVNEVHDDIVFVRLVMGAMKEVVFVERPKIIELTPGLLGIPEVRNIFSEHFEWYDENKLTLKSKKNDRESM